MGVDAEIIKKSGAWYTYEGDQLGQGKENARQFLAEHTDMALEIERRIREAVGLTTFADDDVPVQIAEAESEGETVIAATLSRWLRVSAPAVTMAIRRLKRDSLIRVHAGGEINLTREGREIANRVLQRHQLIERMLTEIFGMEWYKVHDEAEQLEHAVSADFDRKLLEKLGNGEACPHGNRVGMDRP